MVIAARDDLQEMGGGFAGHRQVAELVALCGHPDIRIDRRGWMHPRLIAFALRDVDPGDVEVLRVVAEDPVLNGAFAAEVDQLAAHPPSEEAPRAVGGYAARSRGP